MLKNKVMGSKEFLSALSKYPKEVIIATAYSQLFFKHDEFIRKVKWNDIQDRFDKLMAESKAINEKMGLLIDKKDYKSLKEYMRLMEKDNKVQEKINAVLKEMDTTNKELED